jgi:uncharacterized membrane protein
MHVDQEAEHMGNDGRIAAAAFGGIAGVRSLLAPALLALERKHRTGLFERRKARKAEAIARALQVGALLELVADKLPWVPARTQPISLSARAVSGALVGAALSPRARVSGAVVGGVAAVVAAFAAYYVRRAATRTIGIPNVLAGILEDALAIAAGSRLASALP